MNPFQLSILKKGDVIYGSSQILYFLLAVAAQSALAVIGNIALSLSKNKGKIINSPFTGDEFTRSPSVAQ